MGEKRKKRKQTNVSSGLFDNTVDTLVTEGRRFLYQEEKEILAKELSCKKDLTKTEVLKLLFENPQELDILSSTYKCNFLGADNKQ